MPPDSTQALNLLSDPLKLIEVLGGLFAIIGGIYGAVTKIVPWLRTWRDRRRLHHRLGAELYTPEDIIRATTYYLRPNCQQLDPAGGEESRLLAPVQEDLFKTVDRLLASPGDYKYSILLADSGMGKTSFVLNYYAHHWRHGRKRKRFALALVPLGIPKADEHIKKIPNKNDTVLFLDAFDEDTRAIQNHRDRLGQLLELCDEFRQVLITCRTQFFPREEEIPRETGIIRVGVTSAGQSHDYMFYKLYLSPFSDEQVEAYLKRRFSIWHLRQRRQARAIAQKIPDLVARPMLLAHIKELVQSGKSIQYAFQLYEEMVEAWLERERPFVKDKEALRRFSEQLAVDLYLKRESRGAERVPHAELVPLARSFGIALEDWQLRGRSLLNRDAAGNYKFAHRSIMEYLVVKRFTDGDPACRGLKLTDQMTAFLLEMIRHHIASKKPTSHQMKTIIWEMIQYHLAAKKPIPFESLAVDLRGFRLAFRSNPSPNLEEKDVRSMLTKHGFFDSSWHKEGKGISHLYEVREIKGAKVVVDHITGLMWQQSGSPNYMNYTEAEKYIRGLNQQRFAGYNDWRLPTLEEAMSLMEPKKYDDLYIDPVFDRTQIWIWTADTPRAGVAWVVSFGNGYCYHNLVINCTLCVECVADNHRVFDHLNHLIIFYFPAKRGQNFLQE
ncbi:MAG: DUF1566 domain-containing protein [candidate division KSB1 bacterium]|nr:DUF1566 domain-containing protein [candidate division KSB1 bacterium]